MNYDKWVKILTLLSAIAAAIFGGLDHRDLIIEKVEIDQLINRK